MSGGHPVASKYLHRQRAVPHQSSCQRLYTPLPELVVDDVETHEGQAAARGIEREELGEGDRAAVANPAAFERECLEHSVWGRGEGRVDAVGEAAAGRAASAKTGANAEER